TTPTSMRGPSTSTSAASVRRSTQTTSRTSFGRFGRPATRSTAKAKKNGPPVKAGRVPSLPRNLLDLGPDIALDALYQRSGERNVIEARRLRLALCQRPAEELLGRVAALFVLRLLVHQHEGGRGQ